MNTKMKSISLVLLIAVVLGIAGCENDAQTGALLGGAIGTGVGALAGGDTESTLIGAGVGTGAGYLLGNESDKKKERDRTDRELANIRAEQNTVDVWITNSNGSKKLVRLKKSGPNYIGPRGEIYSSMPSEEDLRSVYGF